MIELRIVTNGNVQNFFESLMRCDEFDRVRGAVKFYLPALHRFSLTAAALSMSPLIDRQCNADPSRDCWVWWKKSGTDSLCGI